LRLLAWRNLDSYKNKLTVDLTFNRYEIAIAIRDIEPRFDRRLSAIGRTKPECYACAARNGLALNIRDGSLNCVHA
jgi:hypothetical protein